ncbi:MAG: hypothetical protein FJZ00_08010 [Candidatus Sericytochromatia bacterium]|uniref:Uncharacterized protein n=1 Tax=Candidatus Tanganyikabacteria bacterium TaxID=2961651 RepID=A0A937X4C4_9BACT|nr:hypothetical protein [Candidatus Tanganyikabacteria bacterium]
MAGVLAALVDIFLVQVPRHPSFLGGPAHQGGWLSNVVRDLVGDILPPSTIHALEREFPVAFDPSTNTKLEIPIPGLGPRTHRFQSPGHDPILGLVFGVYDVLRGTFTGIGKDGTLISQLSPGYDPLDQGEYFFVRLLEALRLVVGHQISDVATPAGLSAPLMPLAMFFQVGSIGPRGYTIGEVARQMYRSGYDFRHFLAGSLSTAVAEVVVRGAWVVRRLTEGGSVGEAMPSASHPRLRRTLFLAHLGATAVNAGKIAITQNPLSLNWAQWLALFRYLIPEAVRVISGDEARRNAAVDAQLSSGWLDVYTSINQTWMRQGRTVITL